MKTYTGKREDHGCFLVTVDGQPLDPRFDLAMHSPTGFAWGYGGSGPAQLAIALLADAVGPGDAERFYHDFKWQVVCGWPIDEAWSITADDLRAWIARAKAERHRGALVAAADSHRDDNPIDDA